MIGRVQRLILRYSHFNWALADQGMVSACNFATAIMLARFLGLEEFGRYTLAWMVVQFLHTLQQVLITAPMMSIGPKQSSNSQVTYFGIVASLQILYGMLTFPVVWAGAVVVALFYPDWNIGGLALPLACAAVADQMQNFLRRCFFTRDRSATAFAVDALRYPGQVAVLFWLLQTTPMDSMRVLWAIAALAMFSSLAFGLAALKGLSWDRKVFFVVVRRHWHFSQWLLWAFIVNQLRGQFFFIVTGALLGATAVGALRAAQTLVGVTNIVVLGLENVVPIRAARHFHAGGVEALKQFIIKVEYFGELVVLVAMSTLFVAPEFWLLLAYGDEYAGYGSLLQWFAAVGLFYFPVLPVKAGLRAVESTQHIFVASAVSAVVAVVSAYPLIVNFGATGAVVGMLIVNVVTLGANGYGFCLVMSRLTRTGKVV